MRSITFLLPAVLSLLLLAIPGRAVADTVPSKPSLYLFLERATFREDDSVRGEIWFANESDRQVDAVAYYTAPHFLILLDDAGRPAPRLTIGSVSPHAIVRRAFTIKSSSDILVGAFQISFTVDYGWTGGGTAGHAFVTAEKGININLLGTDSIAGVPLALAGLIVPGLLFWIVAQFFQVKWAKDRSIAEITIYSIPISLLFILAGKCWAMIDVGSGISVGKLGLLALGGALAGAVAVGITRYLDVEQKREADALQIGITDDVVALLGKLLVHEKYDPQATIIVTERKTGIRYAGSFAFQYEERRYLFGWFFVSVSAMPAGLREELCTADDLTDPHERLRTIIGVMARAAEQEEVRKVGKPLLVERRVVGIEGIAEKEIAGQSYRQWKNSDVFTSTRPPTPDEGAMIVLDKG